MTNQPIEAALDLPAGAWSLDPAQTTVTVTAKMMKLIAVDATLKVRSGSVETDAEGRVVNIEIVVEAASFDSGNKKRDTHVQSADFLDADTHPTIEFRASEVGSSSTGHYSVPGSLEVKGAATSLTVAVTDVEVNGSAGSFVASATIDRLAAGVTKMPSFVISRTVALVVQAKVKM